MFLIDAIKPNVAKKFKACLIFYATVQRREVRSTKSNQFCLVLGLLASTRTLFKFIYQYYNFYFKYLSNVNSCGV